jgi:nucleotide-binding universal stress UspA family protein
VVERRKGGSFYDKSRAALRARGSYSGATKPTMKTVLAPIDFSRISREVINEAITLARATDARLVLLSVVPPPTVFSAEFAESNAAAGATMEAERETEAQLRHLQRTLRDRGVTAHAIHRVGQPGATIVEQAERLGADYIVMGSHGHGAFYDLIVGSTTTRVLAQAQCPVIVVSPQGATRDGRSPAHVDVSQPAVAV